MPILPDLLLSIITNPADQIIKHAALTPHQVNLDAEGQHLFFDLDKFRCYRGNQFIGALQPDQIKGLGEYAEMIQRRKRVNIILRAKG